MIRLIERNKRGITTVLVFAIILLLGIVPITASAAGDVSSDNIITNDDNGIPDTALYNILLEQCDANDDGCIQQSEADQQIALGLRSTEDNQISSLKGLNLFINVKILIVEYNYNLTNLDGIDGMNLYYLIARRNSLTDISQVSSMYETLCILNVENNNLTELPDLSDFSKLDFNLEFLGSDNGTTTSFLDNYLTYEELDNKLPEHLKNQTEADGQFGEPVPIYDGKTLLQYWADFQKEAPPVTNPPETQPTETAPNTDPPETQPTETVPNTDPIETQPTETVPNTDPTETQPATGETLPQPTADPSVNPTGTLPSTPSGTEDNSEHDTGNVPTTNPIEDETQDTTAAPTTDKSDNDNNGGNGDSNVNNNNVGGSGGGNSSTSSGNSTGTSNTQGKSAGTVNTGDNYFVFTLALIAIMSSSFLLIKNRKRRTARYK